MYRAVKRFLDIVIAAPALILLSPLMLIILLLIKLDSPGDAVFRQERLGKDAKIFRMLKFRSMYEGTEKTGSGVYSGAGDDRVTRVGRILRATSLDELPQLINILRGEMSFIGPRPPLTYHPWPVEDYSAEQLRMFELRPGLTGWAQVHGRRQVEWHERIRLNVWYVDHLSFFLDLRILFMTVLTVISGKCNDNVGATVAEEEKEEVTV